MIDLIIPLQSGIENESFMEKGRVKMSSKILTIAFALIIAAIFMDANMAKAQVVTNGLISYWTFDSANIKGETVKDIWGNNDGTIIGDPEIVGGKVGQALKFDGDGDYVEVPGSGSLNVTDAITIAAWVKHIEVADVSHKVFHYRRAGTVDGRAAYQFAFGDPTGGNGKRMRLDANTEAGGWKITSSDSDVLIDTEWHFYAITASSGTVTMYLDGVKIPSTESVDPTFAEGDVAYIGARAERSEYINATIDELLIYDRALSEAEVLQNYRSEGVAIVDYAGKLSTTWGEIKTLK